MKENNFNVKICNFNELSNKMNELPFNRLQNLQKLIKKESALKELCKRKKSIIINLSI